MSPAEDGADKRLELLDLAGVDSRYRRLEQLLSGVAEQVAAGRVCGQEPVFERVETKAGSLARSKRGSRKNPAGLKPA